MNKKSSLSAFLVVILIGGLFLANAMRFGIVQAFAVDSIPKPSVPEFTVELVDTSYDVPTTYSTDPYTGDTVTHKGYHVARRTIEVRIKNQPFTPFTDSGGQEIKFYYNIRIKGHYEEWGIEQDGVYDYGQMRTQSNSEYTVIS